MLAAPVVSSDSDPEVAERSAGAARQFAHTVLEEHGAVVSGSAGSVIGVFGLPAAGEDDPHRAVRAAQELAHANLRVGLTAE